MTRETPTPRTDAISANSNTRTAQYAALARTLERELAAKEEQLAYAIEMRDGYRKAGNELVAERDATIARLMMALDAAYLALLSIPHNSLIRVTTDKARAACRDAIAAATGRDDEAVQNDFEARAALAKATP